METNKFISKPMADAAASVVATYFAIQGYHIMFSTSQVLSDSVTIWNETPVFLPEGYQYSRKEINEAVDADQVATTFIFEF